MGVQNLWPILAPVKRERSVESLKGEVLAVDLAIWLVESQVTGMKMMQGKVVKPHLRTLFFRVSNFLKMGIKLVFVIDGKAPELKWEEMSRRNQSRHGGAVARGSWRGRGGRGRGRGRGGGNRGGRSHFKCWLNECQELLALMGVPCVQSQGEAEAMCAALDAKRVVDGCVTEDGDAFLYGARTVYRNLDMTAGKVDCYSMADIERELGLDRRRLVALALLLGCDYLPKGVPGIGKEMAMRFLGSLPKSEDPLQLFDEWRGGAQRDSQSNAERDVRKKSLKVEGFPNQEVMKEFLKNKEKPPTCRLEWNRPLLTHLQQYNLIKMEWPVEYTQEKAVPLLTLYDLTHATSDLGGHLQPACVVKLRVRHGVQCVEVRWHKPEEEKENCEDSEPFYTTIEDRDLFSKVYPEMVADVINAKEAKKKGKGKKTKAETVPVEEPPSKEEDTILQEQVLASLKDRLKQNRVLQDTRDRPKAHVTKSKTVLSGVDGNTQGIDRKDKHVSSLPSSCASVGSGTEEDDILHRLIGLSLYGASGEGVVEKGSGKESEELSDGISQELLKEGTISWESEQCAVAFHEKCHSEELYDQELGKRSSRVQIGHTAEAARGKMQNRVREKPECDRNLPNHVEVQTHNSKDCLISTSRLSPQRNCRKKANNSKQKPSRSKTKRESPATCFTDSLENEIHENEIQAVKAAGDSCKDESNSSDDGDVGEILPLFQRLSMRTSHGIKPKAQSSSQVKSSRFVLPSHKNVMPKDTNSIEGEVGWKRAKSGPAPILARDQMDRDQSESTHIGLSCHRSPTTSHRNSTHCEVIDLTESPLNAKTVCHDGSDCTGSVNNRSMVNEVDILNVIAEHISQQSISNLSLDNGSPNRSVSMASVIENLGKPMSSCGKNDSNVSLLKLDTDLAKFLQDLSSVSGMLSETRNSADSGNDSVFIVDDDPVDETVLKDLSLSNGADLKKGHASDVNVGNASPNQSLPMRCVLETIGKSLPSMGNDSMSFLTLDSRLAKFLQDLSCVSSTLSDTQSSENFGNDTLSSDNDDKTNWNSLACTGDEPKRRTLDSCVSEDSSFENEFAIERGQTGVCSMHACSEEIGARVDTLQQNLITEGDTDSGSIHSVTEQSQDGWENCDEKSEKGTGSKPCAKNRLRIKKRNTKQVSLHDSVLIENSLARILEKMSPALSPLVRGPAIGVSNPGKILQASMPQTLHSPVQELDSSNASSESEVHALLQDQRSLQSPARVENKKNRNLKSPEDVLGIRTKRRRKAKTKDCSRPIRTFCSPARKTSRKPKRRICPQSMRYHTEDDRTTHTHTDVESIKDISCSPYSSGNKLEDNVERVKPRIRSCSQQAKTLCSPALKTSRKPKRRIYSQPVRTHVQDDSPVHIPAKTGSPKDSSQNPPDNELEGNTKSDISVARSCSLPIRTVCSPALKASRKPKRRTCSQPVRTYVQDGRPVHSPGETGILQAIRNSPALKRSRKPKRRTCAQPPRTSERILNISTKTETVKDMSCSPSLTGDELGINDNATRKKTNEALPGVAHKTRKMSKRRSCSQSEKIGPSLGKRTSLQKAKKRMSVVQMELNLAKILENMSPA